MLSTLEIARYRHAHSEEAKLREQQSMQIAVNNASINTPDREAFCLAIASQINRFVPFSFLTFRIHMPEQSSFYWLMLEKMGDNTFRRVNPSTLLADGSDKSLVEKLDQEAPDRLGDKPAYTVATPSTSFARHTLRCGHAGIRSKSDQLPCFLFR